MTEFLDEAEDETARGWRRGWARAARRIRRIVDFAQRMAENQVLAETSDQTQIAILIRGGAGDAMIAARWLSQIVPAIRTGGDAVIDIYYALPDNIEFMFGGFDGIRTLYRDITFAHVSDYYDAALVINHMGFLEVERLERDKIAANPALAAMLDGWAEGISSFKRFSTEDYHPDLGSDFAAIIGARGFKRHEILTAQTGVALPVRPFPFRLPAADGLEGYAALKRRYITVHDGWDAQLMLGSRRPTKSYPRERWRALIGRLKQRFPEIAIVQLGGGTGRAIPDVDLNLKEAMPLALSARVLAGSSLHIDTDSGLVHIAASLGTRSVVLFGPTDLAYFGYDENANLNAAGCNSCWLSSGRWITTCLLGDAAPRCMAGIDEERVVGAVAEMLGAE